jgi:PKD repeat protein
MRIFILALLTLAITSCEQPTGSVIDLARFDSLNVSLSSDSARVGDSVTATINISQDEFYDVQYAWYVNGVLDPEPSTALRFAPSEAIPHTVVFAISYDGGVIVSDTAWLKTKPKPMLTIDAPTATFTMTPIKFRATLLNFDSMTLYIWSMGDGYDLFPYNRDTTSYVYSKPGSYRVTCAAVNAIKGDTVARDSITVVVTELPGLTLDHALLSTFDSISIRFDGDHLGTYKSPSGTSAWSYLTFSFSYPATGQPMTWGSSNLQYAYSGTDTDTLKNHWPTVYLDKHRDETLDATFEGNKLKSLSAVQFTQDREYQQGYTNWVDAYDAELSLNDFTLVHHSADSIVFSVGGEELEQRITLKHKQTYTDNEFDDDHTVTYTNTNWTGGYKPSCRVKLSKKR